MNRYPSRTAFGHARRHSGGDGGPVSRTWHFPCRVGGHLGGVPELPRIAAQRQGDGAGAVPARAPAPYAAESFRWTLRARSLKSFGDACSAASCQRARPHAHAQSGFDGGAEDFSRLGGNQGSHRGRFVQRAGLCRADGHVQRDGGHAHSQRRPHHGGPHRRFPGGRPLHPAA